MELGRGLLLAAVFDREMNVRRAAAAALQEITGRLVREDTPREERNEREDKEEREAKEGKVGKGREREGRSSAWKGREEVVKRNRRGKEEKRERDKKRREKRRG